MKKFFLRVRMKYILWRYKWSQRYISRIDRVYVDACERLGTSKGYRETFYRLIDNGSLGAGFQIEKGYRI